MRSSPVLPVDQYAELLYKHGGRELTVFEKVYPHVLDGPDALADWTSGTALSREARVLAAADAYQAMREPRPHRPERSSAEAATELRADVRAGQVIAVRVIPLGERGHAERAASGRPEPDPRRRPPAQAS